MCFAQMQVVALLLGCHMVLQGALTAEQLTNYIFYVEFVTYASLSACDEVRWARGDQVFVVSASC